jgi:hypothetical protein
MPTLSVRAPIRDDTASWPPMNGLPQTRMIPLEHVTSRRDTDQSNEPAPVPDLRQANTWAPAVTQSGTYTATVGDEQVGRSSPAASGRVPS